MSKNNRHGHSNDAFADSLSHQDESGHDVQARLQSVIGGERVVNELIPVDKIRPDPEQPRKILPDDIQEMLKEKYNWLPGREFYGEWFRLLFDDEGAVLESIFDTSIEMPEDFKFEQEQELFVKIARLAANIETDGLQSPIGVIETPTGYQIVYGERRWFAFHLLRVYRPDNPKWNAIPAQVLTGDKARRAVIQQTIENSNREELNAIGTARNVSKVLMFYINEDAGYEFIPLSEFEHEQDFYAQIADGNQFPIPNSRTGDILNLMNFSDRSYISRYRKLLLIPREMWVQADRENWSMNKINKAVKELEEPKVDEPDNSDLSDMQADMQVLAIKKTFNKKVIKKIRDRLNELLGE